MDPYGNVIDLSYDASDDLSDRLKGFGDDALDGLIKPSELLLGAQTIDETQDISSDIEIRPR